MHLIKDYLSLRFFRRNRVSGGIAQPQTAGSTPIAAWSIYQSASECPLTVYIKCQVAESWQHLVLSGNPPTAAIEDAGLTIHSEFSQMVGGVQITALINRAKAINILASKIERVQILIDIARQVQYENTCADLADEGYTIDPYAETEVYLKQVEKANSRLKSERLRLDMLMSERPEAKNGKEKVTEADFIQTLAEISKHEGYAVRMNDITVLQYAVHVKRLKDYIIANTPKQTNGSRRKAQ
jgi:uncharacterized protein YihD (DUF1040 family)